MTRSNSQEPERLDAHRAARGDRATDPPPQAFDGDDGPGEPPASFEESAAVKRARHLEQLREVVDAGEYRPDPGKIAESMLDNERS